MADYSKSELEMWSRRIEEIAEESGLDFVMSRSSSLSVTRK